MCSSWTKYISRVSRLDLNSALGPAASRFTKWVSVSRMLFRSALQVAAAWSTSLKLAMRVLYELHFQVLVRDGTLWWP